MRKSGHWLGGLAVGFAAAALAVTTTAAAPGSAWTLQSLPTPTVAPNGQFAATSCAAATACVTVGDAHDAQGTDVALAERWDGAGWQIAAAPAPDGAIGTFLTGVSCASTSSCTAVGNFLNGAGRQVTLAEY